jgi:putative transposase
LITDHPIVWALGNTPFDRQAAYLAMLAVGVSQADLNKLRWATHRGWAIGTEPFLRGVDTEGKRPLSPGKRGRPRKQGAGGGPHSSARFD